MNNVHKTDIGYGIHLNPDQQGLAATFDELSYAFGELNELKLRYAIMINKFKN